MDTNKNIDAFFQKIENNSQAKKNIIVKASIEAPEKWIKEFHDRGYFNPSDNKQPLEDKNNKGWYQVPYWEILSILNAAARKLNQLDHNEKYYELTLETIIKILDLLIQAELKRDTPEKQFNTNYHTNNAIIECISNLPIDKVKEDYIEFCVQAIKWHPWGHNLTYAIRKYLLPYLLKNQRKEFILKLLREGLLRHRAIKGLGTVDAHINSYWLYDFFKDSKHQLYSLCGAELCEHIVSEIKSFPDSDVSINSIEVSNQNTAITEYETQLVFCLRDYLESLTTSQVKPLIQDWLDIEKHQPTSVLFRLAIHGINHHYIDLKNMFWDLQFNPLQLWKSCPAGSRYYYSFAKHEVWKLLDDKKKEIASDEIASKQLLLWAKDLEFYFDENIADDIKEKKKAYQIKWWLDPFKDQKGILYNEYQKQNTINPVEIDHPGWISYHWAVTDEDRRRDYSVDYDQFDLQQAIQKFQSKFNYFANDFHKQDVINFFAQHIAENPKKFINDLENLKSEAWNVQGCLIVGLNRAYINRKLTLEEQKKFTSYIADLCSSNLFQGEDKEVIVKRIVDFLTSGTLSEDNKFSQELWSDISVIIRNLECLLQADTERQNGLSDYLTDSINSTEGKFIESLIYFGSLNNGFQKSLKEIINNAKSSTRLNSIIGTHLAYLWDIDNDWLQDISNQIFPPDDTWLFNATMQGYMINSGTIYYPQKLFQLLKEKEVFKRAICNGIPSGIASNPEDRLIDHIVIGYIQDKEKLEDEDSLLNLILNTGKENQLDELIHYLWRNFTRDTSPLPLSKSQNLWMRLSDILQNDIENTPYKQRLLAKLGLWIELVDDLSEVKELVLKSAPYIKDEQSYQSFFIESLTKHSSQKEKAKICAEIFTALIKDSSKLPTYRSDDIEQLVTNLYEFELKGDADDICNKYRHQGIMFLKDIYNKYNSNHPH